MFSNRRKHEYLTADYIWLWCALAFQAGYANAGGFLAVGRFVSHMTGFGTQVGISLSELDYTLAFEMISAPASFLIGAIVSGWMIDRRLVQGREPHYLWVMSGMLFIFAAITAGGITGWFGVFGEPLRLGRDFALMSLLCFVCGLQNACFGSLTRGQIRTTHLTGILTDIGTNLVKLFYLPAHGRDTKVMRRLNLIRMLTFVSFSSGSAMSAVLFARAGYVAFGFLVISSGVLLIAAYFRNRRIKRLRAMRVPHNPATADMVPDLKLPSPRVPSAGVKLDKRQVK